MTSYDGEQSLEFRESTRKAFCRGCDKVIPKGEKAFFTYSFRNRGISVILCTKCLDDINILRRRDDKSSAD